MRNRHYGLPWILQLLARIPEKLVIGRNLNRVFRGQENLKLAAQLKKKHSTGVIFAVNHVSEFDPIIFLAGINPFSNLCPMFYITRDSKKYKNDTSRRWLKIIYGNFFFYSWGSIFVEPGLKDYSEALKHHVELLNSGGSLCVFAEGGIQKEKERGEARGGITYLAEETGALIVPVHIGGLHNLTGNEFWKRERHATITYGKPFFLNEFDSYDKTDPKRYREVAEKILDRVFVLKSKKK